MSPEVFLAFVSATVVLMLIPGPNVALIAAASIAHGARFGLATVAGTSAAMIVQLILVGAGLNALLLAMSDWFHILRWLGAFYLVYLGIQLWRAAPRNTGSESLAVRSYRSAVLRGLLVSLTNPKTLLFYGAFFPQFIVPGYDPSLQIAVLSLAFVVIAIVIDSGWALAAAKLRTMHVIRTRTANRIAGSLLMVTGAALALVRKS